MTKSLAFAAYLIYLPVVIALTWYVAHTLFKNARVFMLDIFHGRAEMADSTNKLFETGFYLLNLGFALVIMEVAGDIGTGRSLLEVLSAKIGGFSIYLGLMLFINLYFFFRGRRVSKERSAARLVLPGATPPEGA
ncbi:MAG: rane protein [Flaviaesturariibacter sp.]|nr:rane protein [Flaviaesturariibacter sp.]